MIKKSQYVQLALLILFIFMLFLMMAMSISFQNNIDIADPEATEDLAQSGGTDETVSAADDSSAALSQEGDVVVIQGDNTVGAKNISDELELLRKKYCYYKTMDEVPDAVKEQMKVLILCSSSIEGYYAYDDIVAASKQGTDIIFAVLPSEEMTDEWKELLGIQYLGNRYTQRGIVTLGNFTLGGIRWYEDYRIRVRRVKVNSTCKTYVAGIIEKDKQRIMRNEDATDLIWRTIFGKSRIFVINGNFFTDKNHVGILNAVFSKLTTDYVYPIINAKMLFVENAPSLSNENEEEMQKRYARNTERFLEEIAIPGLISLSMSLELQPQFYGTQYFKQSSGTETGSVSFLYDELTKIGGNIQVCAYRNQVDRTIKSIEVFEEVTGKEVTSILFQNNNERMERGVLSALSYTGHISSIVHNWSLYPYMKIDEEDNYVYIPMTTEGYEMDDKTLLWFDEAADSLGLITHGISMEEMIYPDTEDDWSTIYKDFSSYFYTACKKHDYLDGVDGTELEQRVRQYLIMEPEVTYTKKKITLQVEKLYTRGYFILQTEKEIRKMSSGSYKKLEDGAYLLTITEPETEIMLKEKK